MPDKTLPNGRLARPWRSEDTNRVLHATAEHPDEILRQYHRFGRSLTTYAILHTEETTDLLHRMVDKLVSPPDGEDRIAGILELLTAIATSQQSIAASQTRLEARLTTIADAEVRIAAALNISFSPTPSAGRPRQAGSRS